MREPRGDTGRWLSPEVATLGRWTKPYWSVLHSSSDDDYSLRVLMRRSDDGEWQLLTAPAALTYASTLGVFRGEPWCFETWSPGSPPERHLVAAAGQVSPEDWDRQLLGFNGKMRASLRALRVDRPLAQVRLQRVLPLRMRVRPKVGLLAGHTEGPALVLVEWSGAWLPLGELMTPRTGGSPVKTEEVFWFLREEQALFVTWDSEGRRIRRMEFTKVDPSAPFDPEAVRRCPNATSLVGAVIRRQWR